MIAVPEDISGTPYGLLRLISGKPMLGIEGIKMLCKMLMVNRRY
jgi:hypothetical protein